MQIIDKLTDIEVDEGTRMMLLGTRNVLQQICQSFQRINATGRQDFNPAENSLESLIRAALALPDVVAFLANSFIKEDLHSFLIENQLGPIMDTFPNKFCQGNDIWNYFNRSRGVDNFRNRLCGMNFSRFVDELMANAMKMGDGNSSNIQVFDSILGNGVCIVETMTQLVDISPIMKIMGVIGGYSEMKGPDAW